MSSDVNLHTQSTNQTYMGTVSESDSTNSDNQIGKLNGQNVAIDKSSDPTTKDDEVASSIKAEKDTQKAIKKNREKENKKKLKNVQSTETSKNISEQQRQGKRISKQTEARLRIINNLSNEDLSSTIQQRSHSLFSGSEDKYKECYDKFNNLATKGTQTPETFEKLIKTFDDVAEQHNALQITKDVWERKLTNLKTLAKEVKEQFIGKDKQQDSEQQNDYEQLQNQIQILEANIESLDTVQGKLMLESGNRIEDSYKLAPLLREVTANLTHDISLPPKKFNELILDKVLPLNGDPVKTFECLSENLIENNKLTNDINGAISCFYDNLIIITECLNHELKSCPDPKISSAIINVCRTIAKLEAVNNENAILIQLTTNCFPNEN